MWIKQPWIKQKSYSLYSELGRPVFPVESTNNIRIKLTYLKGMGNGCIWKRISLVNACWVSQSVLVQCHEVLITVSDSLVFKKWGLMEIWYFSWKWYWKGGIITKKKCDKNYCQILGWKNFVQVFIIHKTFFLMFEVHKILCMNKRLSNSTLITFSLKVYISLKGNKLASFTNS